LGSRISESTRGKNILTLSNPQILARTLFFTYWVEFSQEGGQYAGTSGTDTIGTFGNPDN
jgi:hypothetical protein